jgi:retron-type reverse transcriptase
MSSGSYFPPPVRRVDIPQAAKEALKAKKLAVVADRAGLTTSLEV